MKRILFSLLVFAVYATANTCTDLIQNNNSMIPSGNVYRDSIYFLEHGDNAWSHKYFRSNGKLDSLQYDPMEENEPPQTIYFYWNTDESTLKGKGAEQITIQKTSNDTTILIEKHYSEGVLEDSVITKTIGHQSTSLEYSFRSKEWTFKETYPSNDTLFHKAIYGYDSDDQRLDSSYIIADPQDDLKCAEYEVEGNSPRIVETIEVVYTDKGFKLVIVQGSGENTYLREFFYVNNENTNAIHKRRAPVKISPKARYFDLLGRYKFSK